MTYPEAIQFLYGLRLFGAKFGLENTRQLAALAGNPQEQLRFIHVAGTNGKGSTCAMLESIYREAGLRVGLFTSPHLVSFRERMQINRELISEADVVRLVTEMQPRLATFPVAYHPTFFEVITVMALSYFADHKSDLVIWETGLGGRLDATNIVTPLASVITNIGLDHQQWLGDTLAAIAAEKAGIIKPGVPTLTATSVPEALAVIETVAQQNYSPLTRVTSEYASSIAHSVLTGKHQQLNAALAVATVDVLRSAIPVTDAAIRAGLTRVSWPGRFQVIRQPDGRTMVLDGAHNPDGIKTLAETLQSSFPNLRPTLIVGMLEDKDWRPMCLQLSSLASRVLTVPVSSDRSASGADLAAVCREQLPEVTACASLSEALSKTGNDALLVVAGSLYLVGEALELLGLSPGGSTSERGLNEWTFRRSAL
ncbi:MAG TPA: folylpolyglutamate synthase/dihydrofolate synthase family protein [Verrucomicrobiae bacterium]|nr:folylpolyglutamate synthase/dihydrofolate synthase family protein [Verrucomicrobiae bacterium]